jgi:hypothetical protein
MPKVQVRYIEGTNNEIKNQITPKLSHLSGGYKVPSYPNTVARPSVTSDKLNTAVVVRRTNSTSNTTAVDTASNSTIAIYNTGEIRLGCTALLSKVQWRCDCGRSQSKSVSSSTANLHNHMLVGLVDDKFGGIGRVGHQLALSTVT